MKKLFSLTFYILCVPLFLSAQCVNLILNTQSAVDNYPIQCTTPTNVIISGSITNLDALSVITEITGDLTINFGLFTNLEGLNNLTSVAGDITISGLSNLESLQGLESLTEVGGKLSLFNNDLLADLGGLTNLNTVGETLSLGDGNYTNCAGLENLTEVGGLSISSESLEELTGLENIVTVNGSLIIGAENIESLEVLSGIESCQNLSINSTDNLPCLTGLETLTTINGNLSITGNYGLLSLTGLENVTTIGGDITITSNFRLLICNLPSICDLLNEVDDVTINNNDSGCNDLTDLQANCGNYGACPTELTLRLQSQIDKFAVIFPNCADFPGNLTLELNNETTNLLGLSILETIEGNFWLNGLNLNNNIADLNGLNNLTSVNGFCRIGNNSTLTTLSGLDALSHVGGNLEIKGNNVLESFNSLNQLQEAETIIITGNLGLMSFQGLNNLQICNGFLGIEGNNTLTSLESLSNLTTVNGSLTIDGNHGLLNLHGLESLQTVGENLNIGSSEGNHNLINLQGLNNLETVGESFVIEDNDELVSLSGFENLNEIGNWFEVVNNNNLTSLFDANEVNFTFQNLEIFSNDILSECAIWSVCNFLANPDANSFFQGNSPDCNTPQAVTNQCSISNSVAKGRVFIDTNCDGNFDMEDIPLNNHQVKFASDNTPFAVTNEYGKYNRIIAPQSNTSITIESLPGYTVFPETQEVVTTNIPSIYDNLDFGLCATTPFNNLNIELTSLTPPRPGFTHQYQICYNNYGTSSQNANINFDFSNESNGENALIIDAAGGSIDGNSIEWTNVNMDIFTPICRTITVEMSVSTELGSLLNPKVTIVSDGNQPEIEETDNVSTFEQEVVGSFDPNDKTSNPGMIPVEYLSADFELEYLIRFQNTGTFPATFIEVLDTIEANLDIATLRVVASSHDYELSFPAADVVSWYFPNINLADSTSNEPESHGFIKFRIKLADGLSIGSVISNRAGIYFDFNEPVITETSVTEVVLNSNTSSLLPNHFLRIFPNPTSAILFVELDNSIKKQGTVSIINLTGSILEKAKIDDFSKRNLFFSLKDYPSGIYIIKMETDLGFISKRFVLQKN